jgi:hypothetical protein
MNAKCCLAALLVLSTAMLAPGDVLVYKMSQTSKIIGNGAETRLSASGRFVWDWDTGQMKTLTYYTLNGSKRYVRKDIEGVRYYYAKAAGGKTYTILTIYAESQDPKGEVLDVISGLDSSVKLRSNRSVPAPTSAQGNPKAISVVTTDRDDIVFTSDTTTYTFSSTETLDANKANQTVDGMIDYLTEQLLRQGYQEAGTGSGGGGGGGGSGKCWVRLQAIGSTYAARPSIEINGVVKKTSSDYHGCSYETGPSLAIQDTFPSGTRLTIKTTAGYLKTGSQIFIWKDGDSKLLYDNSKDTLRDSSVTRVIP